MLKIAVCDDNEEHISALRKMLDEWSENKPFAVIIYEYTSAESFLFSYPDKPCDIILMDIEMKNLNGMELAKKLRKSGDMLPIIFITGYSEYIGEGYDVEALHYLLKPVEKEKLFEVLDKYTKKHDPQNDIVLSCNDKNIRVDQENIRYCEARGKKTEVHIPDKNVLICNSGINDLQKILGENFIFCHRSYLVNLRFIKSISKTEIEIDGGENIPLSRRLYKEVNERFIEFYTGREKQ